MTESADVFKQLQKDYGDVAITRGSSIVDFERQAFGIFALDLALGGGIPIGKMSMVFGSEASGKTTIALLLIAQSQRDNPDKAHLWVDAEWGFDPTWAKRLGVDLDRLFVGRPETGEQAASMVEGLVYAEDVGLIVVDSIAGMVPQTEVDGEMSRMQVGGNSLLVGRMVRKTASALIQQSKRGVYPTIFFINQLRKKIGVMFGNPETYCGGHALRHYCNMIFRTYGKDIIVEGVSKTNPAMKEVTLGIKKWKVPIVSKTAKYQFALVGHNGIPVGGSRSWNVILAYAKDFGYIAKVGKSKWSFGGEEYKTQAAIADYLVKTPEVLQQLKEQLIVDAVALENKV